MTTKQCPWCAKSNAIDFNQEVTNEQGETVWRSACKYCDFRYRDKKGKPE